MEKWNRNLVSQRRASDCAPSWGVLGCLCGVLAQCGHSTPPGSQQMPARHKQIGQGAGHEQAMSVLLEPAVADLGKAEHPLDNPDRMLDFGSHLRFGAVFRSFDLVHNAAVAIAAVDKVPRPRRV